MKTYNGTEKRLLSTNFKRKFGCGVLFASLALAQLSAEIFLKPNVDNFPQAKANILASIDEAYKNDTEGYFKHLVDSKTDNMFVDIDVNNKVIGAGVAALQGDTAYYRDTAKKDAGVIYHEAEHYSQDLKLPSIDNILPPFYAMYLGIVREAGGNWQQLMMAEKVGLKKAPPIPEGMTAEEFNNQRFNKFFEEFLNDQDYLTRSLDSLSGSNNPYKLQKFPWGDYKLPAILTPGQSFLSTDNIYEVLDVYMGKVDSNISYLPTNVKLDHNAEFYYNQLFKNIIANFDKSRKAEGKSTVEDLNNQFLATVAKTKTILADSSINAEYTYLLTPSDITKLCKVDINIDTNNQDKQLLEELLVEYTNQ